MKKTILLLVLVTSHNLQAMPETSDDDLIARAIETMQKTVDKYYPNLKEGEEAVESQIYFFKYAHAHDPFMNHFHPRTIEDPSVKDLGWWDLSHLDSCLSDEERRKGMEEAIHKLKYGTVCVYLGRVHRWSCECSSDCEKKYKQIFLRTLKEREQQRRIDESSGNVLSKLVNYLRSIFTIE